MSVLQTRGPIGLIRAVGSRLVRRRLACAKTAGALVAGKTGLEIGGPSDFFARGGPLPLYPIVARLDNCNFSTTTIWEGQIQAGQTFRYDADHAPGRQYIAEATDLSPIAAESYEFVLSSHTIEHSANPLKALREWTRTLKTGGALVLVVPHKDGTFDHRRPVTTLEHLVDDDRRGTAENDLTHLPEILACHDLALDPPAGDFEAFKTRSERNFENRCLHHHVFDTHLVVQMVDRLGLQFRAVEPTLPYHIVVLARKPSNGESISNDRFLGADAEYRLNSPFAGDR